MPIFLFVGHMTHYFDFFIYFFNYLSVLEYTQNVGKALFNIFCLMTHYKCCRYFCWLFCIFFFTF